MPSRPPIIATILGVGLTAFTIAEVNFPLLTPQSQLAIFATFGMLLCLWYRPLVLPGRARLAGTAIDFVLMALALGCGLFLVSQTERSLADFRLTGVSLGNRAGRETGVDIAVGVTGILLVLETTRRVLGLALPILSLAFLGYALFGAYFPGWLFPHRGYSVSRIVSQTFLQSQGVFGIALNVMFTYVFLFVIFGALLQATGATQFIIDFARRIFRNSPGAPAKVSVVSSGLMGSLSGSAVANTATTGTFTIPMMRASGFPPHVAGAVEAAASTGGALVPPVMGAGAYMMLEMINPPVTYLQIIRAALIPGILYYLSLFLIVHFYAKRVDARAEAAPAAPAEPAAVAKRYEGVVFAGALAILIVFLLAGYTPFRSVTIAVVATYVLSVFHPRTRLGLQRLLGAIKVASRDVVPLICASACVGIVLAVVTLTGVGTRFPALVLPLADGNLLAALGLIMVSSIVLGMGLPSSVCYLLIATLMGPVLNQLGVVPLAAHLFIFYFGMMSMVTPPVALAAYAAASIAGADVMRCGFTAFRFALVGFTLPFIFVYRPELLLLPTEAGSYNLAALGGALLAAVGGIVAFAGAISGCLLSALSPVQRALLFVSAALLLAPGLTATVAGVRIPVQDLAGFAVLAAVALWNRPRRSDESSGTAPKPAFAVEKRGGPPPA
jgi:TRAP transporter 4TM/12TM fusion protein